MTLDQPSDEMLMALADGELPEAQAQALRRRIRADPALAARHAVFVDTRRALAEALDPGPVPERLLSTIRQAPAGTPRPSAVGRWRSRWRLSGGGGGLALAASVLVAVGVGGYDLGRRMAGAPDGGGAIAAVRTVSELPTGAEVALADGGVVRVLGSFDSAAGFCRLLATRDGAGRGERIVACRDAGVWRVVLSVEAGGPDAYATASDTAVELVDGLLDRLGAGPALSVAEERQRLRGPDAR